MDQTAKDFKAAAARAFNGQNDGLYMAIYDRLHRAPESVEECEREIQAMSRDERVLFGAEDWSDDSKQMCPRCRSEHRGRACPSSDALASEGLYR